MGDTKELFSQRWLKITRLLTAVLFGVFFLAAVVQIVFFQEIKISFDVGTDAQQIETIKIKKGSAVELPKPLKPGSYFLGWSLSPQETEILESSTGLMTNTTLYAVWDGAEKYAVLSVNGIPYKEVNVFDTSVEGLTATQLNQDWRVLDDFAEDPDNTRLTTIRVGNQNVKADKNNNFSRFLGWQYLNMYGRYNDLLYEADETGVAGTWTLVQRDVNGAETRTVISDTNKFYPPNYRTTFTALLQYRTIYVQVYDQDESRLYASFELKPGDQLPTYKYNPLAHFSHWVIGNNGEYNHDFVDGEQTELVAMLNQERRRYEAGEKIETVDPLWYYFGSSLGSLDGRSTELATTLTLRAVYWDDVKVPHFSIRPFTDVNSGTDYISFNDVSWNDLSLENPVAYEEENHCIWLLVDNKITSYTFYDHNGVYHELTIANLKNNSDIGNNKAIGIGIDVDTTILDQKIYFNNEWAITIGVNYQTAATDITVKFNYGDHLYSLPNYRYYEKPVVVSYTRKIGNTFVMLTGENYMKSDYIFTGWRLVGDESGRLYCAGETFTIPNFDISSQQTVVEFVAVWHLQRLLFDFDFMGGAWKDNKDPDFTFMKGAFGERVRIVSDIPVKFGYDFVGWKLEGEDELLQPGAYINVGTKFQTLQAQWQARRLSVTFYTQNDANENSWYLATNPNTTDSRSGETLYAGGYINLPFYSDTEWYLFQGWQIGNQILNCNNEVRLTTEILSQLETKNRDDYQGTILEVKIYAKQLRRTVNVNYDFNIQTSDGEVTVKVDSNQLESVFSQGKFFYDYYPFSVAVENGNYSVFDTGGRQFAGWSYSTDGGISLTPIYADTRVPAGVDLITIYGGLSTLKSFTVEYYDFLGNLYQTDRQTYYYNREIDLIKEDKFGTLPAEHEDWGIFTGWALEQDYEASNPDIIYDVHYNEKPVLKLSNKIDTNSSPYLIDIDSYTTQTFGTNYLLKLYAVYAADSVTVTYDYRSSSNLDGTQNSNTELKLPVYSNKNYQQTVIGGSTVGYDSSDFLNYGLTVLDDSTLSVSSNQNFVGWKIIITDEVNPEIQERFENKIWFPGEYLPSFNFSFEFYPIRLGRHNREIQEYEVGNRTYRILSLSNAKEKITFDGSVDIVALPRGTYTVNQGNIVIKSDREVHVVVPASSNITLEPRSIQCNSIKEFYVGENLNLTGSPVVGDNFQAYRVKKGYRLLKDNGEPSDIIDESDKYDFESSMSGLLVSRNRNVLHGVPSHSKYTTEKLFDVLTSYPITHIKEYALSDINNLTTINLGINLHNGEILQIEANAIYNVTAKNIILPTSEKANDNLSVDPQVIAGALRNLTKVTFGDTSTLRTWYAFVDSGFVYYIDNPAQPSLKVHVMYVLPAAEPTPLDFTLRNLRFENSVTTIEPTALMGRDWSQINSIMVENSTVDLTKLLGIPTDIPLFTAADNPHQGPMIQPYEKTFIFTCRNSISGYTDEKLTFKYGETFTVFNAQKNNYKFYFNKTWSQFVGWKLNGVGRTFYVGEVYKVGISEEIIGDGYTVTFDAYNANCWTYYPVQFYVYNEKTGKNEAYTPEVFHDFDGVDYTIDELLEYYDYLDEIYLPSVVGEKQKFTTSTGVTYQFIGWSTKVLNLNNVNMWNDIEMQYRILPNQTINAVLDSGYGYKEGSINIYRYYALYEIVTPYLEYELLDDQTFAVTGLSNYNISSLHIPFAQYHEGYMLPVSKINAQVFNNISTKLNKISIGGAVSEIGEYAFFGVKTSTIDFAQRGRGIYYNYRQTTPVRQLSIGNYAFANNTEITTLQLPAALTTLENAVFQQCVNLRTVTLEENETSALRNIGDEVFSENQNMVENAVVNLLTEDGKNGNNRFVKVGAGIFRNTNIKNLVTNDGQVTNKIVWRDTLLYVYYPNGFDKNMIFNEKEIAGYAFVNAYSTTDDALKITLRFANPNVKIDAHAFTNLPTSITSINLNMVNINNVDIDAFDTTVMHTVNVVTGNLPTWNAKFKELLNDKNNHFIFS